MATNDKLPNVGIILGQRLFYALCGKGIDAKELETLLYGELHKIAAEATEGDWIELPNGTTYTLTFKPGQLAKECATPKASHEPSDECATPCVLCDAKTEANPFGFDSEDVAKLNTARGYKLTLSESERNAFDWVGNRYSWGKIGEVLAYKCESVPGARDWNTAGDVTFLVPEPIAWSMRDLADEDTEGGHSRFPCASRDLAHKLNTFMDRIV